MLLPGVGTDLTVARPFSGDLPTLVLSAFVFCAFHSQTEEQFNALIGCSHAKERTENFRLLHCSYLFVVEKIARVFPDC